MSHSEIKHVASTAEFDETIANNNACVVKWTAKWCGPCKRIAPQYQGLALQHKDIIFLEVDVDELDVLAKREDVRSMPQFFFYFGGKLQESFSGANVDALKNNVVKLQKRLKELSQVSEALAEIAIASETEKLQELQEIKPKEQEIELDIEIGDEQEADASENDSAGDPDAKNEFGEDVDENEM